MGLICRVGGGGGLIVCIVFVCVRFTDRWAYQWGGGEAYKKQLKEQYPVTLLRMYQPLIFLQDIGNSKDARGVREP